MVNKKLASTLNRIKESPTTFYDGDLADDIVKDIAEHHGIIDKKDLKNYKVLIDSAVNASIKETILYTAGLPSSGILITFMLNVLKGK